MANFDVVESASYGYRTVWEQRMALVRLATFPFLIKLGLYALIMLLGMEDNYLRHGLVLLPAYFAEGFLLAYVMRLVMSGGDLAGDFAQGRVFARDIMAAMIIYVLIQLSMALFVGSMLNGMALQADNVQTATPPEPNFSAFMGAMILLAGGIWAFRLIWLYVPAALGVSVRAFLVRIAPFKFSFKLMGCWLMCFIPFAVGMLLVAQILGGIFPPAGEGEVSPAFSLAFAVVQSGVELMIALVSSIAMAYGVKQVMEPRG